jgi:hypothetical protein
MLRWKRERFIERVRVQRLGSAEHGGQRLYGNSNNVVVRLLCR